MAFIGNTVQTQGFTPAVDYFSGNGSTVTFTLSRPVAAAVQVEAVIDNVVQNPSTAYTVSGNAITFTSAPLSGSNNIYVRYTSLITTYNGISQSPSVIGDLTASGGYLSTGSFNNSFVDGTIVDYVTGNGRLTVGSADGFTLYTGGTSGRTALASWTSGGVLTNTGDASISGLTVGKGGGSVASNTALGLNALAGSNSGGGENTGLGQEALNANTTGADQVGVGYRALAANTTGTENTAIGAASLRNTTTGSYNVALGRSALNQNTSASYGTAVGYQALYFNTTGANNTAFGTQSLKTNTTGAYNVAIGGFDSSNYSALYANTTGSNNTALGSGALTSNTTASNNTAVGYQAGYSNTTGIYNAFFGYQAGYSNAVSAAAGNTFIGALSGNSATTGTINTFVGASSGTAITTGAKNTIIGGYTGNQGGLDIRTSNNYIVLSDGDGNPRAYWQGNGTLTTSTTGNDWAIYGNNTTASGAVYGIVVNLANQTPNNTASQFYAAGDSTNYKFRVYSNGGIANYQANNVNLSDETLKKDIQLAPNYLDKLCQIPVKTYLYKDQTDTDLNLGVIAQEVKAICPELVGEMDIGKDTSNIKLAIYETDLKYAMLKAIQELNAKVTALEAKLEAK